MPISNESTVRAQHPAESIPRLAGAVTRDGQGKDGSHAGDGETVPRPFADAALANGAEADGTNARR
jgi:hypothetical protein